MLGRVPEGGAVIVRLRTAVLASCFALLSLAGQAHATFPGANGKIAFGTDRDGQDEIYAMNADGTSQTRLTNNPAFDHNPAWSPDGTKIAFQSTRDGNFEIYTMNADGSNPLRITNNVSDQSPAWSPDGTKIAFSSYRGGPTTAREIYTMNADGTNQTRLTINPYNTAASADITPAWSPDGSKVAFVRLVPPSVPGGDSTYEIYTINADGTNETRLTNNTANDVGPAWSPDGTRIAFETTRDGSFKIYTMNADGTNPMRLTNNLAADRNPAWSPDGTKIAFYTERDNGYGEIYSMNADGTNPMRLTNNTAFDLSPDWQPLPINAYPRPKGASPMQVSLVPAYKPCAASNNTHGAPLAFSSCSPPQLASTYLTTGTPDANGRPVRMNASLTLKVLTGDVQINAHLHDVANSDLTDYTGTLRAQVPVRITDKLNTPHPGGPGAATTQPFVYGFTIPCATNPGPTTGSDCTLATSMNALAPGTHADGRRAVWQLGQVRVYDGGTDADGSTTADNTVFAVQGVFIP